MSPWRAFAHREGRFVDGCNGKLLRRPPYLAEDAMEVENASYGAGICAERTAMVRQRPSRKSSLLMCSAGQSNSASDLVSPLPRFTCGQSEGHRKFLAIAVARSRLPLPSLNATEYPSQRPQRTMLTLWYLSVRVVNVSRIDWSVTTAQTVHSRVLRSASNAPVS
jgi:hypothetical protein